MQQQESRVDNGDQEMREPQEAALPQSSTLTPLILNMEVQTPRQPEGEAEAIVAQMLELAKGIQDAILTKPVQKFRELNTLFTLYWSNLVWPYLSSDPQRKANFYTKVYNKTVEQLLKINRLIDDSHYLHQILQFFRHILSRNMPLDLSEEGLCEVLHSLFKMDSHFYTVALQSDLTKRELHTTSLENFQRITQRMLLNQDTNPNLTLDEEAVLTGDQKRILNELPWRRTLMEGDRIDALLQSKVGLHLISHWVPATVSSVLNVTQESSLISQAISYSDCDLKYYVHFEGQNEALGDSLFPWYSPQIAPFGTYTSDFDWRYSLKVGDLIDCLDVEGTWYRSTVLKIMQKDDTVQQDIEMGTPPAKRTTEVFVGYRYYTEEEGHRQDEDEIKKWFVGWSHRYDTWLQVESPQVQRLNSMARMYKMAGKSTMIYDEAYNYLQDMDDYIYNSGRAPDFDQYATFRQGYFAGLRCIPEFINEFGQNGGFRRIIELFEGAIQGTHNLSLKQAFHLIEFLSKICPILHRQFAYYIVPLMRAIFERVITNSVLTVKFHRDFYKGALKSFTQLIKRYYTSSPGFDIPRSPDDNYHLISSTVGFVSACCLLRSEKLELRVAGLNEINEQLKNTRFGFVRKGLSDQAMLRKLTELRVLNSIFSGAESHVQLISRGEEILKFLVDQKAFNEPEIRTVWSAVHLTKDENTKLEFYKILETLQVKLMNEDLTLILELFSTTIEPERFMRQEIECVSKLMQYCQRSTSAVSKALDLLFDVACQARPYSKDIIELAIDKLLSLLQNLDREVKKRVIDRCYNILSGQEDTEIEGDAKRKDYKKASLQCIRLMSKILDSIPDKKYLNYTSSSEIALSLVKDYGLLTVIIFDLSEYIDRVNAEFERGTINKDNFDSVELFNLPFTHRSNIASRLSFIRQLLNLTGAQIQKNELDQIWDILQIKSKLAIDQQLFFDWFKQLLQESRVSLELIHDFFEERVCAKRSQPSAFADIKKAGFDCMQSMFLMINEQEDLILIISLPSVANGVQTKLDFQVLASPSTLRGIEVMWKVFQDCDKKNKDLASAIAELIVKLYINLSELISREQVESIQDEFCGAWLEQLQRSAENPSISEEEKKLYVQAATVMMRSFLSESEKQGLGTLRPHSGLDRGNLIEKVIIQNQISSTKSMPKLIELNVYQNMTLWELKILAGAQFRASPLRFNLRRTDAKKTAFDDANNGKLLKELCVESYEILQAERKPIYAMQRKPLLNKKKELTPDAYVVFKSWFAKFSVDGYMHPQQCAQFVKYTTGTMDQVILHTDARVVNFYREWNQDADGRISEEDFIRFYRIKAAEKPEAVWKNLTNAKYGNDLKPLTDMNSPDDQRVINNSLSIPRAKMTLNQDFFNELIRTIQVLPQQAQDELWQLVSQQFRTNPVIYAHLLGEDSAVQLSKKSANVPELLYSLQIIESFINEYNDTQPPTATFYFTESQDNPSAMAVDNAKFPPLEAENQQSEEVQMPLEPQQQDDVTQQIAQANPDVAIPLPPPPPYGIPLPHPPNQTPAIQVPFIGPMPPPASGTSAANATSSTMTAEEKKEALKKVTDLLRPYKDFTKTLELNDSVIPDKELAQHLGLSDVSQIRTLRQDWINKFIKKGGISLVLSILSDLNGIAHKRGEALKSKLDRDCLLLVLRILKVLLMTTFISRAPKAQDAEVQKVTANSDASTTVIDTSSGAAQGSAESKVESADGDKKGNVSSEPSKIKQEQDRMVAQFRKLVEIMSGEVGDRILSEFDLFKFQDIILSILRIVLSKKETLSFDEAKVAELALGIWVALVVQRSELLPTIYQDKAGEASISSILIQDGLMSNSMNVRLTFRDQIQFIIDNVKGLEEKLEKPFMFFLRKMLLGIETTTHKFKDSRHFYQLLIILIKKYFKARQAGELHESELFDEKGLLDQFINRLVNCPSNEKRVGMITHEDNNLIGYLQIIGELLSNNEDRLLLSSDDQQALTFEIIHRCLFSISVNPLDCDIVPEVDIAAHERPQLNKCLSKSARTAAFNLLLILCKMNPTLGNDIIQTYLYPIIYQRVKRPKKSGFNPSLDNRINGYCGLKNLGCICYMNSMVQQFFNIPTFRYSMLALRENQEPNWVDLEGDQINDNFLFQLRKLFGFLELSERQEYNPRELCHSFKDYSGQPVNVRIQQDAQEYMGVAFDKIENLIKHSPHRYLMHDVFAGQVCAIKTCGNCGKVDESIDDFINLTLQVNNQRSIGDGLRKYTDQELIEGYKCENCKQTVNLSKRNVIQKLPNMLFIHLQRIVFDMDTFLNKKLNNRIEFPNVLDMRPYMKAEVLKQERIAKKGEGEKKAEGRANDQTLEPRRMNENNKEDENESIRNPSVKRVEKEDAMMNDGAEGNAEAEAVDLSKEDHEYKLVGVVVHMGTADAGHYLSYINISRGEKDEENPEWLLTEKDKWLEFNDSSVRQYNFQNIESDCFGGGASSATNEFGVAETVDYTKNAYMLVYEKRRKEPIKVVITEDVARVMEQRQTDKEKVEVLCKQYPELNGEKLLKGCNRESLEVEFDNLKREFFVRAGFNSVQRFVPNDIYKMVHEDNMTYLYEKQIFSAGFFEAVRDIYKTMLSSSQNDFLPAICDQIDTQPEKPLFQFMEKLVFDLISMAHENKCLSEVQKVYFQMLGLNYPETVKLIENRILKQSEGQKKDFFDTLVSSLDVGKRETNAGILLHCLNQAFLIDDMARVERMMEQMLLCIPDDLTKNWLKINQFLQVLKELSQSGPKQLLYLMDKKIVTRLIDFFLENDSPSIRVGKNQRRQVMGSNYARPPLEQLIYTISTIVRMQTYVDLEEEQSQEQTFYYPKYSIFTMNKDYISNPVRPLCKDDRLMLQNKAFMDKLIRSPYDTQQSHIILLHLCSQNRRFSRRICKMALVGLNKANYDEVQNYIKLLNQLLIIPDHIRNERMEWILGVPRLHFERPNYVQGQLLSGFPKVGVETMKYSSDEVVEYRSNLFKYTASNQDSYLQLLYAHKNKDQKFVVEGLLELFRTCLLDPSRTIFFSIQNMPGPTYLQARFLDWVKPFLTDQIDFNLRHQSSALNQLELQNALQANQAYTQLITEAGIIELIEQSKVIEANQQNPYRESKVNYVLNYDQTSRNFGPQQYVMWRIVGSRVLESEGRYLIDDQIEVTVTEYQVLVGDSVPDTQKNHAFPKDYFIYSYNQNSRDNDKVDSSQWGKQRKFGRSQGYYVPLRQDNMTVYHKAAGRGSSVDSQPRQSRTRTKGVKNRPRGKKLIVTGHSGASEEYHPNQNPLDEDGVVQTSSDEEEAAGHENSMDVDYRGVIHPDLCLLNQNNELTDNSQNNNQAQDKNDFNGFSQSGDYFEFNPHSQEFVKQDPQEETKRFQDAPEQMEEINASANKNQESSEVANENLLSSHQEPLWCILVYTVTNLAPDKAQTVKLSFKHQYPALEDMTSFNPNCQLPMSEITALVGAGLQRDCLIIPKLRPAEKWSPFTWDVTPYQRPVLPITEFVPEMLLPANMAPQATAISGAVGAVPTMDAPVNQQSNPSTQAPQDFQDATFEEPMSIDPNQVACQACTYLNSIYLSNCEMCTLPLKS